MESAFIIIIMAMFKPRLDKALSNVINFNTSLASGSVLDQMTYRGPFPPIFQNGGTEELFKRSRLKVQKSGLFLSGL